VLLGQSGARAQSPTAITTVKAIPTPYADAVAVRDQLLTVAKSTRLTSDPATAFGVYTAWIAAFPGLDVSGPGLAAHGSVVSAYNNLVNEKKPASSTNPQVLAFAVTDAAGKCALGGISGYPAYTTFQPLTLPSGAKCTGDSAINAFEASFATSTATPATATTTAVSTPTTAVTRAPGAPATGSGAAATNSIPWAVVAAAASILLIGAAAAVLSRRT
jgi:hypothetical protein